jgi:GNAT superfamily N-acetyltransferase
MSQDHDLAGAVVSTHAATFELLAATLATGRTRRGPDGTVLVISGTPIDALNMVISPALEPNADEIASLAAAGSPWELPWTIQVRGEAPDPRVTEVAARYGLTRIGRRPLMIRRPEQGPPAEAATDRLRVRAVPAAELGLYNDALADGFEAPRELFRPLADPVLGTLDSITFYLAESDGVPVGTGMTAISGGLTGLFNITTLPRHRRRGYGRAITMELVRAGFAAGAETAYLYASTMGEPVYAAAGFSTEEYLTVISAQS